MTKLEDLDWKALALSLVIWSLLLTGIVTVYKWVTRSYVQCLSDRGIHEEKQ